MTLHELAAAAGKCSQPAAAMKSTFPVGRSSGVKERLQPGHFGKQFSSLGKLRGPRAKANGIPDRSPDNKPMRSMSRPACSSTPSRDTALPIAGLSWESYQSQISPRFGGNLTAEASIRRRWLLDLSKTRARCGIRSTSAKPRMKRSGVCFLSCTALRGSDCLTAAVSIRQRQVGFSNAPHTIGVGIEIRINLYAVPRK
jgi:hypothetical protein